MAPHNFLSLIPDSGGDAAPSKSTMKAKSKHHTKGIRKLGQKKKDHSFPIKGNESRDYRGEKNGRRV